MIPAGVFSELHHCGSVPSVAHPGNRVEHAGVALHLDLVIDEEQCHREDGNLAHLPEPTGVLTNNVGEDRVPKITRRIHWAPPLRFYSFQDNVFRVNEPKMHCKSGVL